MFVKLNVMVGDPAKLEETIVNTSLIISAKNIDELPGVYLKFAGKTACEIKLLDGRKLLVLGRTQITNGDITFTHTAV